MPERKLRVLEDSGYVSIPKDRLRKDGLVEDGSVVDGRVAEVERVGSRAFLVRVADDDQDVEDLPTLRECGVIQREVALALRKSGAFDVASNARAD